MPFVRSSTGLKLPDLLVSSSEGNKKLYRANTKHPLFPEIHKLLIKHVGVDKVIKKVITNIGDVDQVYLVGELSHGSQFKGNGSVVCW